MYFWGIGYRTFIRLAVESLTHTKNENTIAHFLNLSYTAFREGNDKHFVFRGKGDFNEVGILHAELMNLGLKRWV